MVAALGLGGCADKEATYQGIAYAPTHEVKTVYHFRQVPPGCKVFAHVLISFPADSDGSAMQQSVYGEAERRGADVVFLGQSRQMEDDEALQFRYYGPESEYDFRQQWKGWKWGFDQWRQQGQWVGIGAREWGAATLRFEYPVMTQAAFLRCSANK
ncbi:MAG: hypothetical protein CSA34_06725 [Desulfobulbus propionicus]|nr:MAG: hypothetical protein CSA34_06725 [Desulfobulbus propionicus]